MEKKTLHLTMKTLWKTIHAISLKCGWFEEYYCDDEAVVWKKEADAAQEESEAHEPAPVARLEHDGVLAASWRRLSETFRRIQVELHVSGTVIHLGNTKVWSLQQIQELLLVKSNEISTPMLFWLLSCFSHYYCCCFSISSAALNRLISVPQVVDFVLFCGPALCKVIEWEGRAGLCDSRRCSHTAAAAFSFYLSRKFRQNTERAHAPSIDITRVWAGYEVFWDKCHVFFSFMYIYM